MQFVTPEHQTKSLDVHSWLTALLCDAHMYPVQLKWLYLDHTCFDDLVCAYLFFVS